MITLRDYQVPAVDTMVVTRHGICQSPAGSGKTIIAAAALDRWIAPRAKLSKRRMRLAWIANTQEQCDQAQKALALVPRVSQCGDVTVGCYASGIPLAAFDMVILDECHHVAAPEYRKMLEYHDGWRWGFSATPFRADDLRDDVFALIGPVAYVVERGALVEAGQLATARVLIHTPNQPKEMEQAVREAAMPLFEERKRRWPLLFKTKQSESEQMGRCVWQVVQEIGIGCNSKRNGLIIEISRMHRTDSHLIIIGSVEHGEKLQERIPGSLVVHSKMGAKRRREAVRAFGAGELRTMIATSLADEGLDVPRANVLTLAAGGRSAAKAEQRTGRVLRSFNEKTHGTIHDFMDQQHYFLLAQSKKRIALYRELGYEIKFANQGELL